MNCTISNDEEMETAPILSGLVRICGGAYAVKSGAFVGATEHVYNMIIW
jgi:hypothetical protein